MSEPSRRVTDPTVLRAIAHPVRNRILGELSARGHLRAADVARELGIPANQASFHLRQLAKYRLVEPAPELARDGRDRVWKPTHPEGLDLNPRELLEQPGGEAAVSVWRTQALAQTQADVARAFSEDHSEGTRVVISDEMLRLSKAEAGEFFDELKAVKDRWQARAQAEDRPGRRTYQLLQILQPADDGTAR